MPHYYDLLKTDEIEELGYPRFLKTTLTDPEKKRAITKILEIKQHLRGLPRKRDDNLMLCSWNLKEFGQSYKHPEFYYYIAEIMSAFDIIAIQEVRRSIKELTILRNILGENWSYIINDVTEGEEGNNERSAILYNTKRTDFNGFSGELVADQGTQLKRTPHITGFLTGWKNFSIINVHLDSGKDGTSVNLRKQELEQVIDILKPKLETGGLGYENIILLGDFNFYPEIDNQSIELLKEHGFEQLQKLESVDTTLAKNKYTYDHIFIRRDKYFEITEDKQGKENGGVVKFRTLFENDLEIYRPLAEKDYQDNNPGEAHTDDTYPNYFWVHWLSRQMSDHYPIWIEINTDSSVKYLESKLDKM